LLLCLPDSDGSLCHYLLSNSEREPRIPGAWNSRTMNTTHFLFRSGAPACSWPLGESLTCFKLRPFHRFQTYYDGTGWPSPSLSHKTPATGHGTQLNKSGRIVLRKPCFTEPNTRIIIFQVETLFTRKLPVGVFIYICAEHTATRSCFLGDNPQHLLLLLLIFHQPTYLKNNIWHALHRQSKLPTRTHVQ